jgi:hypothetical protein
MSKQKVLSIEYLARPVVPPSPPIVAAISVVSRNPSPPNLPLLKCGLLGVKKDA